MFFILVLSLWFYRLFMSNFTIGKLGIICDYKQDMLDYVTIEKLGISN